MSEEAYEAAKRSISEALQHQKEFLYLRGLTALPPEIGELTGLRDLHVEGQLTALPPEIGQLKALEWLVASRNRLTMLPPEIGQLTALEKLELDQNLLATLPFEIGQLSALFALFVSDNRLTALPPEIGQLASLKSLHLSDNKLTTLPPEIGQLRALTSLQLANNRLTALPPEILQLARLADGPDDTLFLHGNPLQEPYPLLLAVGGKRFVFHWLAGRLNLDALRQLMNVETQSGADAVPLPVQGVLSPVDFTVSAGGPIRAKPSVEVQPVFNTAVDRREHKPRLDLCRDSAAGLIRIIEQGRFNVRGGYRQILTDYVGYLPASTRTRNLLFADQEARILRDLFDADAADLPPEFASRLRALLQAHIALRVFYPGVERFYDDVRFGRTSEPLPVDAVEALNKIVGESPVVFHTSVGQALSDAAPSLPEGSEDVHRDHEGVRDHHAAILKPPNDPLGTLPGERARALTQASIINRLWAVFLKGEALNKNAEAWIGVGSKLVPFVRPIIRWLVTNTTSG